MKLYEKELRSEKFHQVTAECAKTLGYEVYIVGGFVRDLLLERPSKDIDFVCVGSGIRLAKAISKALGKGAKLNYFKNFGTASISYKGEHYEFVGARKESYNRNSRKPIIEEGSLIDDQNRRDFSINAMAISLNEDSFAELVDPFDGVTHLKKKMIKTPLDPAITFSDDPLRIMRAIRFATQLGFDIDPVTFEAMKNQVKRLEIISQERITTELNKIIATPKPSYGFKLLFICEALHQFFPEMVALHGVETREGKSHKDNFYHTLQVLDNICKTSDNLWLRWAAILHDIAKPATKRFNKKVGWTFYGHEDKGSRMVPKIFKRLKLPLGENMTYVKKLVLLHLRPIPLVKKTVTDSAVRRLLFEAGKDVDDLMKLCRADITSKNYQKVQQYLKNFDIVEQKMIDIEAKDQLRSFQPIITGELIMKTFDLQPSRLIGDIKDKIREAILEGEIKNTMEEAFPYLLKVGAELNLKVKQN